MEEIKLKGPIEYIKEAWRIYSKKENFIFFAKIMAVLTIITTLVIYPFSYFKNDNNGLTIFFGVLMLAVGFWVKSTTYSAIFNINLSEKEVFKLGFTKMGKFLLIALVVGLIVSLGTILLIVPAIIFGIWYSFSTLLVLDKNMGIKEALKQSKAMVKGRFWKILGRSFVFELFNFLISILLLIIPLAGNLIISFIAPLYMLPFYLLYKDLSTSSRL